MWQLSGNCEQGCGNTLKIVLASGVTLINCEQGYGNSLAIVSLISCEQETLWELFWFLVSRDVLTMDEGRERDQTSRRGGLPTLPGLYLSTIQPSQRGFFWVHMCVWRERKPEAEFLNFLGPQPSIPWNWFLKGSVGAQVLLDRSLYGITAMMAQLV
jgi:hypothetical protein